MANPVFDFDSVDRITAEARGAPGHRTFYLQAQHGATVVTLICEKEHVAALADAIDEALRSVETEYGLESHRGAPGEELDMALVEPLEPLFRVGAMGLGYDEYGDKVMLVAQELLEPGEDRDFREVRFRGTRAQMLALSVHARRVVARGRTPEQRALQSEAFVRRNGHGNWI